MSSSAPAFLLTEVTCPVPLSFLSQLGHRGVVRVQQDLRPGHAAPPGSVPPGVRQPKPDGAALPLPAPGEARDHQHLPAQDLQRVADPDRLDLGTWGGALLWSTPSKAHTALLPPPPPDLTGKDPGFSGRGPAPGSGRPWRESPGSPAQSAHPPVPRGRGGRRVAGRWGRLLLFSPAVHRQNGARADGAGRMPKEVLAKGL